MSVEVRRDPVTGQIAVVDARGFRIDQGQARAINRQQLLHQAGRGARWRRRPDRAPPRPAGHRGRAHVEVERADIVQRGTRSIPDAIVGLGTQRGRWSAESGEPFAGDGGEVADILW